MTLSALASTLDGILTDLLGRLQIDMHHTAVY